MKTIVGIITVFIVLGFAVAGSAPAQFQAEEVAPNQGADESSASMASYILQDLYPPKTSYGEAVLVVPAAAMKPEDFLAITEDMNIMARIFDKQLNNANLIQNRGYDGYYFLQGKKINWGFLNNIFGRRDGLATETMYLEGFGAIFLMKVGFPLIAPPKVEEKAGEDDTDKVWQQTKKEIYMPDLVKKRRIKGSPPQYYEPEKVEKLKRTLIGALKHASNIRALTQDKWVILTVTESVTRQLDIVLDGELYKDINWDENGLATLASSMPAVLTICVKKSDIDAFAKGELDYDKFRQRTKIFTTFAKFGREDLAAEPKVSFSRSRR